MSFLKTSLFIIVGVLLGCFFFVFINSEIIAQALAKTEVTPAFIDFDPDVLNLKSPTGWTFVINSW